MAIQGLIPPAPAAATQLANFTTVLHTKFVSAGIGGMAGTGRFAGSEGTNGSGTIVLRGVTGPVTKALLYWHGPTTGGPSVNARVLFNGNDITGINIGTSSDNCWGFPNSQAYRADVTSFVTGDGSYDLKNFQKKDGNTLIADTNGASLIVFFDDPTAADLRDVTIFDGNDSDTHNDADSDGWSANLSGIRYAGGQATLQLHVSDGQDPFEGALLLGNGTGTTELAPAGAIFSGNALGTRNINPSALGSLWDVKPYDIPTSSMTAGVNNLSLSLSHNSDCISLIVALVSVPTPIRLTPLTATRPIFTEQTMTATIQPTSPSRRVTITIKDGPNKGPGGTADTNGDGQAFLIYASKLPGTDTISASFTVGDTTFTSNDATVVWTGVVGTAKCPTITGESVTENLLRGGSVELFTGSVRLAGTPADTDDASYHFTGLAPNATYAVRYTSADGTRICGQSFTTDATGSRIVPDPTPAPYLQNSTWLRPYELKAANSFTALDNVPTGKSRWYVLRGVPAQSQVNVNLSAAEVDLTLVAYRDIPKVAERLSSLTGTQTNVQQLTASQDIGADDMAGDDMAGDDMAGDDMAGDDMAGDDMAGDDMAGDDMAGDALNSADITKFGDVYTAAQPPSVLAVSAALGHAAEFLSINARAGGDLYFRVRKSVRELLPADAHYSITATYLEAPGCKSDAARAALAFPYAASPIPSPIPTGKTTLILTNTAGFGLTGTAKANFLGLLTSVASKGYVNGTVYDLANNTGVMKAYNDWVASSETLGCVELANRVTDVIKNVIKQFRDGNTVQYQYGVSAGGDKIIPLRRVLDRVPPPLKTEVQYSPPLAVGTAVDASLAGNYYLTTDFYTASSPITRFGGEVWLPEFSWGILVETPDDIKAYLDTFTAANGLVQNPGKALSLGFDWNADTAAAIAKDISDTGANVTSLITKVPPYGTSAAGYTAADIKTNLTNLWSTAGFLGVQGHATATSLKAADNATHLYTTDIADIAAGQPKTTGIVVTLGCHSAFNVQDGDVTNPLVQKLAWPEAFIAQGKTLLGGTGYQYAETILIKNTERLLQLFTRELRYARGIDAQGQPTTLYPNGEVPIGTAHVNAKRLYMSELTTFTGLDQKVLGVSQIFGMPMLRYDLPGTVGTQRLDRSAAPVAPSAPDADGLSTFTPTDTTFNLLQCNAGGCGGASDPSYFAESPQLTHAVPFRPIIARKAFSVDANIPTVARGAVILNATFTEGGASPLTTLPVTEQPGNRPPYVSPVFSPWPIALNEYLNQQLVWMPTQYKSNPDGTFTIRKFSSQTTQVYYSNLLDRRVLVDAPVIRGVEVSANGNFIHLVVTLQAHKKVGDLTAGVGIKEVWATSRGGVQGTSCLTNAILSHADAPCFTSELMNLDSTTTDPLAPDRVFQTFSINVPTGSAAGTLAWEGFIQAVGRNGLVRVANNMGALYRLRTGSAASPKTPTQLVGSAPTPVAYRSLISPSATLSVVGTSATVPLKPVTFRLGSVARTGTTGSGPTDSGVASVQLAVEVLPRPEPYKLLVSFAEDDAYLASGFSQGIVVTKAPTQFNLAPAPTLPSPGTAPLATLVLKSDGTTPINEQLVQIDLGPFGSVLTTTDGFGKVVLDTSDFGGFGPGTYSGTISTFANRLYAGATVADLVATAPISFMIQAQTFPTTRSVQGQGNFTLGLNTIGLTQGSPATFEFNVQLPANTTIPNGKNLGFHVKSQNFDFAATTYEWMTIVGNRATVAGLGTITTATGQTTKVPYRMLVDDSSSGDRYEIRIGTFTSPQYAASSMVKSSAITIK